jgi:ABC-type phosphate/phosphonate transport system substrate-binding protein
LPNYSYSINTFQDVNIKDAHAITKVLAEMLVRKKGLNMSSKTFIFDNLSMMKKALNDKKLDVVVIPPLEYLELLDHVSIYPFLVTTNSEQIYSEYLLLVSQKKGIKQVKDLKNKKLIVGTSSKDNIPLFRVDKLVPF